MHYLRRLTWLAVAGMGLSTLTSACSDRAWLTESRSDSGSLGLALRLDPELGLRSVHYELSGPNGYVQSGEIDVSGASRLTHVFERLPAGSYSIALSAVATGDAPTCSGSADFVIRTHATTSVTVNLQCRAPGRTGSVVINGVLNVCPSIESLATLPHSVLLGEATRLSALASDYDRAPEHLTYAWQADEGAFSDPTAQNPTFTAANSGTVSITLTVSDGNCSDAWSVDVEVLDPAASSAPAASNFDTISTSTNSAPTNGESTTNTLNVASSDAVSESTSSAQEPTSESTSAPDVTSATLLTTTPRLVASAVGARSAATPTTSVTLPAEVQVGDLAVAFLLATGTPHTITTAPVGFVNRDLAAINHRLSYGTVSNSEPLVWTLSANATTSATVYFFRGDHLGVHVAATNSANGANFDTAGATNGPATTGAQTGFALFSVQLPVSNTPTITAGPGGTWVTQPVSDGVQLFTWSQPYTWGEADVGFALPSVSGSALSASATKRTAQVVVHAPVP